MYEYRYINVESNKLEKGFDECKAIIDKNAKEGWRLSQIVMIPNDKIGVYKPKSYELIFERKI